MNEKDQVKDARELSLMLMDDPKNAMVLMHYLKQYSELLF